LAISNVKVPDLGGATDVTVIEILVKSGDKVEKEMPVVTLESDKATMEIPTSEAGIVKEIKVKVGDKVSTGSVLLTVEAAAQKSEPQKKSEPRSQGSVTGGAVIVDAEIEEEVEESRHSRESEDPSRMNSHARENDTADENALSGTLESDGDVHAGPGVRRLAREFGVNLSEMTGSGPKQRILKEDVQAFVKARMSQAQSGENSVGFSLPTVPAVDFTRFGLVESMPLSRIQKISGRNLQRNWITIPHVTQFGEADISSLEEFRVSQKADLEKKKIKLTPLVFVMKAVISSLKAFPHFNASLEPDGETLVMKKYFNVGVAVDTPDGLVVPVVRDVDKKGLIELAKELAEISEKARNKQLTPGDMQGGCFSVSSLGGIGGTGFTPIINAPEVAILGVSKATYKPVYEDGEFKPHLMVPLSLSYDHRVIDGADGARFMVHLTNMLSDIRNLLL
jgi:pyruvate dehydrogenase E2 component (dihydrolipoamide acetyltransferase)